MKTKGQRKSPRVTYKQQSQAESEWNKFLWLMGMGKQHLFGFNDLHNQMGLSGPESIPPNPIEMYRHGLSVHPKGRNPYYKNLDAIIELGGTLPDDWTELTIGQK